MKKILLLFFMIMGLMVGAQCPAPTNINIINNIALLNTVEMSWTENGTATAWEITVVPDFDVGTTLPTYGTLSTSNSFIISGIPPSTGCYAFFVRSICSPTETSNWSAVSLGCSASAYIWLQTLSNTTYTLSTEEPKIELYPNPSKSNVHLKSNSKIETITVYDSLGKALIISKDENNTIDVERLSKGIYIIEVLSENSKSYRKFIKE